MKFNTDSIRIYSQDDYVNTISDFISIYKSFDWMIAIGQFGHINDPGISDIDLIIIVKNGYLALANKIFNDWVIRNTIREYLFYHGPVFINENLIQIAPYLHSLEHIRWLTNKNDISFTYNTNKKILILSWITFLLPIIIKILHNIKTVSIRESLLILKNIHTSHYFISELLNQKSKLLQNSIELRSHITNTLRNEQTITNETYTRIENEYKMSTLSTLSILDKYSKNNLQNNPTYFGSKYHYISNLFYVRETNNSNILSRKHRFEIGINNKLVNLFFNYRNWKSNPEMANYVNKLEYAYNEYINENIRFQFILPLGYPIFMQRHPLFRLKKRIQLLKNHHKI